MSEMIKCIPLHQWLTSIGTRNMGRMNASFSHHPIRPFPRAVCFTQLAFTPVKSSKFRPQEGPAKPKAADGDASGGTSVDNAGRKAVNGRNVRELTDGSKKPRDAVNAPMQRAECGCRSG